MSSASRKTSTKILGHHAADHVAVSDALRVKVVHVGRKATASEIRRSLGISGATVKRAQVLVKRILSQG